MSMTILSIAYPFAPVGERCIGGAEQILTDLDCALVRAGHRSLVLACAGSTAAGTLFSFPPLRTVSNAESRHLHNRQVQAALDRVLAAHPVDLVHMHGFDFYEYQLPPEIPMLATLHLPLAWYPQSVWRSILPRNMQLQCVSESQRRAGPEALHNVPVIPNGVELPSPEENRTKQNFAMVLGRICPEKNQHAALQACFQAGISVLLGGHVFGWPEHQKYFREKVKPLLDQEHDGIRHHFLGVIPSARRAQLLARARCLLHPTLAPETSSLAAMEALAAGTPVIAYPSGALPEIIEDGVTGFLVDNTETMAAAIRRIHRIAPESCRAAAARFSKDRMIRDYFDLYAKLIRNQARKLYA